MDAKITFKLTQHAKKRIYQRNITPPSVDLLKKATTKIKKAIRNNCKHNGYNKDYTYLTSIVKPNVSTSIYVCQVKPNNVYKIITVFKLPVKNH